ncbi:hypothetical protein L596_012853 [Steinernema carpocapsae]|uniref:Uncharacterized protein n=1 Tax=Steinernema carpocapsae TaxID=34508 RepID=A0A4V6A4X6_STECR|nr:hypothetical protein L596_012853 [Steinernema carpocapsae]
MQNNILIDEKHGVIGFRIVKHKIVFLEVQSKGVLEKFQRCFESPHDTPGAFPAPALLRTAQEVNITRRPLLLSATDRPRTSKKRSFLPSAFSIL